MSIITDQSGVIVTDQLGQYMTSFEPPVYNNSPNYYVSQFIPNDFPLFTQLNGPDLVSFIQAYYEWMEQTGNVRYFANNLRNFRDIDNTLQQFISHFQYEYLNNLPGNIEANKQILIKHILDLYRSKGTKRGIALLFRILFNEDVSIYFPGNDIFKTSAARWNQPIYIEVSDSTYLNNLVGNTIYSLNGGASALVEDYVVVRTSNKVINILYITNVFGSFLYGDYIMSTDVLYDPTVAPKIVGSLTSVSIDNGGVLWNVGDIVTINGSGTGAFGRVASTTSENGKVFFTLNDGGYGFTVNAVVEVTGGSGTGATFKVGSLTNQTTYQLNTDIINTYYNEQLDITSEGFSLNLANYTGSGIFLAGETVNCVCSNSVDLDYSYVSGSGLQQFETLSNTSLSISVEPIIIDDPSFARVIGTDTNLNLLQGGQLLSSSVSNCIILINSVMPKQVNICNGVIQAVTNSSSIIITNGNDGYPMPTSIVTGLTSTVTANVQIVTRLTNWDFPVPYNTNLDTPINLCLTYEDLVIGTIASLSNEDPGNLYASNPIVTVTEPDIKLLAIDDGHGGIWGADANVTANATFANGIATSIEVIDSGFGFDAGEFLQLSNPNNVENIQGFAITKGNGIGQGYWSSNPSGTSDTSHIIDSYYYQNYSYELTTGISIETFKKYVENIMGPLGYLLFGKYRVADSQIISSVIEYNNFTQTAFTSLYSEPLTVTSTNNLSLLTNIYIGNVIQLIINGSTYFSPYFSINNYNKVIWNSDLAGFSINTSDIVFAIYSYTTQEDLTLMNNLYNEPLTVTSTNVLTNTTYTPNGLVTILYINGTTYLSFGGSPEFSVSGNTVTWSATNSGFSINTSDVVYIFYTYTS